MFFLLIRDTPLGKAYVLGTFLTREVTDMGFNSPLTKSALDASGLV